MSHLSAHRRGTMRKPRTSTTCFGSRSRSRDQRAVTGALVRTAGMAAAALALLAGCGAGAEEGNAGGAEGERPEPQAVRALLSQVPPPAKADVQAKNTFVGTVPGSDEYVAVVVGERAVIGYVCDGRKVSSWTTGPAPDDARVELASADGKTRIRGTVQGQAVRGTVTVDGRSARAFTARRAVEGRSGLFRERNGKIAGKGYVLGWIFTEQGVRGLSAEEGGNVKTGLATSQTPGSTTGTTNTSGTGGTGASGGTDAGGSTSPVPTASAKTCFALADRSTALSNKIKQITEKGVLSLADEEEIGFLQSSIMLIISRMEKLGCL